MDRTIDIALAASMEQISAHPVVSSHVGGKLGKMIKTTVVGAFIAAALSAAPGAMAQSINGGCVLGAVAGGLLGNTVGGGHGRTIASAAGAVFGCNAGQQVQANTEQRQQRPAGYPVQTGGYSGQPSYGGGYGAPVVDAHPMGNYMQHTFAQLNGQESPSRPLTTQGHMAMEKALGEAERRMDENLNAQRNYASAYEQLNQARMAGNNPEAQVLMGSQAVNDNQYRYEGSLNRAAQVRSQANMGFGNAGMRLADISEYEASQGYDVREFGERIQRVLSAPMSAPVTGVDPTTKQRVTFSTSPAPSYRQPRSGY